MMFIRRAAIALVVAVALGGTAVQAQGNAEAIAEAKALMQAGNTFAMVDQMLDLSAKQITALIDQLNPGHTALVEELMQEHFIPEFKASYGELEGLFAEIYARHFTAAEMRELRAFYDTPLGKKALAEMPNLISETARVGQLWGEEIARRALEKLKPALEENGLQAPDI